MKKEYILLGVLVAVLLAAGLLDLTDNKAILGRNQKYEK